MKGTLNLWLLLVVAVFALSIWFGRDLIPPTGGDPGFENPTGGDSDDLPQELEAPIHLVVLNGTDNSGLAREFGLLLGQAGCVPERVGNAPHDHYEASFLVNRQLSQARATKLARELGGVPILKEFDGRSTADAVLVLGRDADRLRRHLRRGGGS